MTFYLQDIEEHLREGALVSREEGGWLKFMIVEDEEEIVYTTSSRALFNISDLLENSEFKEVLLLLPGETPRFWIGLKNNPTLIAYEVEIRYRSRPNECLHNVKHPDRYSKR